MGVILISVPLARSLQKTVSSFAGGDWIFPVIGLGAVVLATLIAAIKVWRRRSGPKLASSLWLLAVAGAYAWYARNLPSQVEVLHFLEYGVLGLLAFRALRCRTSDLTAFLSATLICTLMGTLDEAIQWFTPKRYFEFRDIWLNTVSGGLAQIAIWKGWRPAGLHAGFTAAGLRRLAGFAMACAVALGLCALNTPTRAASYAQRIPALAYLENNPSVMAEYGHRYEDPEIGVFFSRSDPEALAAEDQTRAVEVAILDEYQARERYPEFLAAYPSWRDPFAHEARVHLFRRDRYLFRAGNEEDLEAALEFATIAAREHRVLERYFPATLAATTAYEIGTPEEGLLALEDLEADYESAVSRHLFTRLSERRIVLLVVVLTAALWFLRRRLRSAAG